MKIQYLESTINPNCFFVAVDGVVVGNWISANIENRDTSRWIDLGIYRPVRSNYKIIKWNETPFDPSMIFNVHMFNYVKQYGREMPLEEV
jgi:hypothetical protein